MHLPLLRLSALAFIALLLSGHNGLAATGNLDLSFNPGSGSNGTVYATAVQPDGKVIIGGSFTAFNGVARNRIARLNTNGLLDTTFDIGSGANAVIYALALQPDGKIVIGGDFTLFNGLICTRIARLNSNGSVDPNFDVKAGFEAGGANGSIVAIARQGDGKIIIGGDFTAYRNVARNRIARVNADGTLDTGFFPLEGANNRVATIALAPNGYVVIGGSFTAVNGISRPGIARLKLDGYLDTAFTPSGVNSEVNAVAVLIDGEVLVGGLSLNDAPVYSLVRLNVNGSLDTSFQSRPQSYGSVTAMLLQPDGKIVVAGNSASYPNTLERLNSDGSRDLNFDPTYVTTIRSISLTPQNNIIIGGDFTTFDGTSRPRIARVIGMSPPALRNISTRCVVQTGERVAIAGFIITGTGPKEVLLRGIGPSLTALGVPAALQDPMIELYNSSGGLINSNNNWRDTQQNAILETTLQPSDNREAALLITLGPGSYTVMHKGVNQTTGNGLIELYDLTGGTGAKLANISTRAFVGTGDNVLIGGFILAGDDARVVVRAIGPSLASAGVSGALADPRVALYNGNGGLVGFNLNWRDGQEAEIAATGLQPSHDLEAAVIVTLQAGNYTAIVEGFGETTGVGSVEVYNVSP